MYFCLFQNKFDDNLYLYIKNYLNLCKQVENFKWILCSRKIGIEYKNVVIKDFLCTKKYFIFITIQCQLINKVGRKIDYSNIKIIDLHYTNLLLE